MIDTKELRIGNVIYLNGKKTAVSSDDIAFLAKCQLLGINCEATPVRVTEETLKTLGFTYEFENVSNRVYSKDGINLQIHSSEGICLYIKGEKLGKSFFYVHQLQNLWFSLLGKEITNL